MTPGLIPALFKNKELMMRAVHRVLVVCILTAAAGVSFAQEQVDSKRQAQVLDTQRFDRARNRHRVNRD